MRYLFLDVDGVLNNCNTKERINSYVGVDPKNVEYLKQLYDMLTDRFGEITIILSSSWRANRDRWGNELGNNQFRAKLDEELSKVGLVISDITPWYKDFRGREIMMYLATQENIEGYLVLDDVFFYDFDTYFVSRHLSLTSWYGGGLTSKNFRHAMMLMERPLKNDEIQILNTLKNDNITEG